MAVPQRRRLVAVAAEDVGTRSDDDVFGRRSALRDVVRAAARRANVPEWVMQPGADGSGVMLACDGVTAADVATGLVGALDDEVDAHNRSCPPRLVLRLRVAAHPGEPSEDGSGPAVSAVWALAGSDLLRRVLAAAHDGFLAVILSAEEYDELSGGRTMGFPGYDAVVLPGGARAWVRVPDRSHAPGLTDADIPPPEDGPAPIPVDGLPGMGAVTINVGNANGIRIGHNSGAVFGGGNSGGSQHYGGATGGERRS